MPFTDSDLVAIDVALKTGTQEVRFQDRTVKYQSTDDMLKVRSLIWNELNPLANSSTVKRQIRMITDSGF